MRDRLKAAPSSGDIDEKYPRQDVVYGILQSSSPLLVTFGLSALTHSLSNGCLIVPASIGPTLARLPDELIYLRRTACSGNQCALQCSNMRPCKVPFPLVMGSENTSLLFWQYVNGGVYNVKYIPVNPTPCLGLLLHFLQCCILALPLDRMLVLTSSNWQITCSHISWLRRPTRQYKGTRIRISQDKARYPRSGSRKIYTRVQSFTTLVTKISRLFEYSEALSGACRSAAWCVLLGCRLHSCWLKLHERCYGYTGHIVSWMLKTDASQTK